MLVNSRVRNLDSLEVSLRGEPCVRLGYIWLGIVEVTSCEDHIESMFQRILWSISEVQPSVERTERCKPVSCKLTTARIKTTESHVLHE